MRSYNTSFPWIHGGSLGCKKGVPTAPLVSPGLAPAEAPLQPAGFGRSFPARPGAPGSPDCSFSRKSTSDVSRGPPPLNIITVIFVHRTARDTLVDF